MANTIPTKPFPALEGVAFTTKTLEQRVDAVMGDLERCFSSAVFRLEMEKNDDEHPTMLAKLITRIDAIDASDTNHRIMKKGMQALVDEYVRVKLGK